jgi:c-di-GMP-binding flagellar brake protein YcgR
MPTYTATIISSVEDVLAEACERNTPADIEFAPSAGPTWRSKVRLLRLDDDTIATDTPVAAGMPIDIPMNTTARVYFCLTGQRFAFDAYVIGRTRVRLNSGASTEALALSRPTDVQYSQRRKHFRLSVAAEQPIPCRFYAMPSGEPDPGQEPPPLQLLWEGRLLNISAGGVAYIVDRRAVRTPRSSDRFIVEFALPEPGGEFRLVGEIRHVDHRGRHGRQVIGVQFIGQADGKPFRACADRLNRYVIQQQRRRAHRRR